MAGDKVHLVAGGGKLNLTCIEAAASDGFSRQEIGKRIGAEIQTIAIGNADGLHRQRRQAIHEVLINGISVVTQSNLNIAGERLKTL